MVFCDSWEEIRAPILLPKKTAISLALYLADTMADGDISITPVSMRLTEDVRSEES
jgi:hypothetical protein